MQVTVRGELVVDLAYEQLDALAHLLAEDLGEVALAVARVVDRRDQRAEAVKRRRRLALHSAASPRSVSRPSLSSNHVCASHSAHAS